MSHSRAGVADDHACRESEELRIYVPKSQDRLISLPADTEHFVGHCPDPDDLMPHG
jgi:hypothetical protein